MASIKHCTLMETSSSSSVTKLNFKNAIRRYTSSRSCNAPSSRMDPYQTLEVDRGATEKDIKLAYFRLAKKHHPDLNSGDPKARERFQKVAAAYEILRDPLRRRQYDTTGHTSEQQAASETDGAQYTYTAQQHAEDMFRTVTEDADVVRDAVAGLVQDMQDEFTYAAECAARGEWNEVWEVLKTHKGLVFGVVVPLALIFRFPALVIMAGRMILAGSQLVLLVLLRNGQLPQVARWVWARIVALARERNSRKGRPGSGPSGRREQ